MIPNDNQPSVRTDSNGPQLASQSDSFDVLVALVETFPTLPAPYVTVQADRLIGLQLMSPAAFEAWRAALDADVDAVTLQRFGSSSWLTADVEFLGAKLQLTGHGLTLPRVSLVKAAAA